MQISFKYRFILSFVILEILFLAMIAVVNFNNINKNFENFITYKENSLKSFGNELLVTPVSIYDTATIDNIVKNFVKLDGVISMKVWDSEGNILSQDIDELEKSYNILKISNDIIIDNLTIGRFTIFIDSEFEQETIKSNKEQTISLILIEILISTFLSWVIGHKIAESLNKLTNYAHDLSEDLNTKAPKISGASELKILSDTLEEMKIQLLKDRHDLDNYRKILDEDVIVSKTNLSGKITYVSKAFCKISGYTKEELIGKHHKIVRHPDMPNSIFKEIWETIKSNNIWHGEIKNKRKDNTHYWVNTTISPWFNSDGEKIGYIAVRQDISDKKIVEELSVRDHLTKLYNRIKLDEEFSKEISRAQRFQHPLSVIILDIDHFKDVNDTYGHLVGDSVLVELAKILENNIRSTDILGRWGGEEFVIICPETDSTGAENLAEKIRENIEKHSFSTVGNKTASFGVSQFISKDNEQQMIARADKALYDAKENGRNRVIVV